MLDRDQVLSTLVEMSRRLGSPEMDAAILGEGNTSARIDGDRLLVKASGTQLPTISAEEFCEVRMTPVLALLEAGDLTDDEIKDALQAACADPDGLRPSIETVLHALLLSLEDVNYVGHTHPTAVNSILCSKGAEAVATRRLFPDEIVVCGPASVYVPYTDPGPPLARMVRDLTLEYIEEWGAAPKVILMQNHGLIALGAKARDVENITAMAIKAARTLLGTYALGGPSFLTPENLARIYTRPDEAYRQALLSRA